MKQDNPDQLDLGSLRGLRIVGPPAARPAPVTLEGEAMLEAARELRRIGLTLPERSAVRADLLASASDWMLAARMHGVRPSELLSA